MAKNVKISTPRKNNMMAIISSFCLENTIIRGTVEEL
jgi:hypothetical protein